MSTNHHCLQDPSMGKNKRFREHADSTDHHSVVKTSFSSYPWWLPNGCKIILAPIYAPRDNKAKFAFPVNVMYNNLASLLGLTKNPWTKEAATKIEDKHQEEDATIKIVENDILRHLGVTHDMCSAYVKFRRLGTIPGEAIDFMIRTAAPQDLVDLYQNQKDEETMFEVVTHYMKKLGSGVDAHGYDIKRDHLQMFRSWSEYGGHDRQPVDVQFGKTTLFVELHSSDSDIDNLRKRIRNDIYKTPAIQSLLRTDIPSSKNNKEILFGILRNQIVPLYHLPLMLDSEEDHEILFGILRNQIVPLYQLPLLDSEEDHDTRVACKKSNRLSFELSDIMTSFRVSRFIYFRTGTYK